jgi:hypothetical protein
LFNADSERAGRHRVSRTALALAIVALEIVALAIVALAIVALAIVALAIVALAIVAFAIVKPMTVLVAARVIQRFAIGAARRRRLDPLERWFQTKSSGFASFRRREVRATVLPC